MNLRSLNSLTKYPSIPTYHVLGEKGRLTDERVPLTGHVIAREKIDGTNARIILSPDGYYLGSREELLHFQGDRVWNPALGIVDALRPMADRFEAPTSSLVILYGEVYGGNVTAASKQYTSDKAAGFRLFDVVTIADWRERVEQAPEQIAAWRDGGGQQFWAEDDLSAFALLRGLNLCPLVYGGNAAAIGTTHEQTLAFLREMLPLSKARLDDAAGGRPEGIVVRNPDRGTIVKIRYEDYERTLKARKGA